MTDGHGHYQQLAVGHVLGGLDPADAADFRSHLLGCRDCRARVAELRGIASDLERAERDERAQSLVRTEVAPRHDQQEEDEPAGREPSGPRVGIRHVTLAVVVVALMAAGMAFWNLHLRTTNAVVTSVAEQQARTLEVLASGVAVDVEAEHPIRGLAATDGDHVAVALTGVEPPGAGTRVIAWLHDEEGPAAVAEMAAGRVEDGRLALLVEEEGATVLELTVERGELGQEPEGASLATVELRAGSP